MLGYHILIILICYLFTNGISCISHCLLSGLSIRDDVDPYQLVIMLNIGI
ncbi:hypothetical protein HanIR_Chr05g0253711 [Helianthus annuus]|nr:hypothetical protein HanIR_Chr05g0253711 [Helianthus annuus]